MIEKVILDYLSSKLGVKVLMEDTNENELVTIEKVGGSKTNHLFSSSFTFQSYSTSKYKAAMLNEKVIEAVEAMIELDEIIKIKLEANYDYTDTETKRYRYQALFDITHY